MRKIGLHVLLAAFVGVPAMFGQGVGSKMAVIDMERAVVENTEGKKAAEKWNTKFNERKTQMESKQKELEEAETKLRTQERALSEAAKAELNRVITQKQTEITRLNEDSQKELEELRGELLRPIAEKAQQILGAYAKEQSFTVIFDVSTPNAAIVYVDPVADITTEIIRRIDAELAKTAAPPKKQ